MPHAEGVDRRGMSCGRRERRGVRLRIRQHCPRADFEHDDAAGLEHAVDDDEDVIASAETRSREGARGWPRWPARASAPSGGAANQPRASRATAEAKYSRPAFSSRSLCPDAPRTSPTYCIRVRSQIMPTMNSAAIAVINPEASCPQVRLVLGGGGRPAAHEDHHRAIARFTAESTANSEAVMMFACVPTPNSEGIPATEIST